MTQAIQTLRKFKKIFIHKEAWQSELARRLRTLDPEKIQQVEARPFPEREGDLTAEDFNDSKQYLFVTPYKGQFFKRCPGAKKGLACCNYFVLNLGLQCDMNCSYCYLQSYINTPILTIYSNIEDALAELQQMAETYGNTPFRVGTGETIDSLSLDELTLFSQKLIMFFNQYPQWKLEFKTKSNKIDQFIHTPHKGNTIVSWSINPQYVIDRDEQGTASLKDRLDAAQKCRAQGFQIAFHIDPMIYFEGWQEHYAGLVETIAQYFSPEDMPYISMGALRFQPEQRHMMRERFGLKSLVVQSEMHLGSDGKLRYDHRVRQEMFQFISERFKAHNPQWKMFLCMETPETWIGAFQKPPSQIANIQHLFKALPSPT